MKASTGMPVLWVASAAIIGVPLISIAAHQHAALRLALTRQNVSAPLTDHSSRRDMHLRISDDAAAMAVSLTLEEAAVPPGLLAVNIDVIGPQPAVIGFAERIETRPPAVRFISWKIVPDAASVRLTATAVAPASPGR